MANFNQTPSGQTTVSGTVPAGDAFTITANTAGGTMGPRPAPIRYFESPDGQLHPQLIPIS